MTTDLRPAGSYLLRRASAAEPLHRLFCFSYAGGGAGAYSGWRRLIPPEVDLIAIQLPGRENRLREPHAKDLSSVVEDVVAEMEPLLDRPCSFFGHSFGGLLAYECCVALQQAGRTGPGHLVVSGANPPGWPLRMEPKRIAELAIERLMERFGWHSAGDVDLDIASLVLQALRADLDLLLQHRFADAVLPVHLTVLGASDDPVVSTEALQQWASFAPSHELVLTTGGHFFFEAQHERIVKLLLERANGGGDGWLSWSRHARYTADSYVCQT